MLECVPNVSAGRDIDVIAGLAAACGPPLLDVHVDADHNRSVFTLAALEAGVLANAIRSLAREVAARVSIAAHEGVHPRSGALDVVPFVALTGDTAVATQAAREFARWWATSFAVPVFFYDGADEEGRTLPATRAEAFRRRAPDLGPARPHPELGATAVGARAPLVAINCLLDTADVETARAAARVVRERDGGLPGVRALGFFLAAAGRAQVSMNVTDLARTGIEAACDAARDAVRARGADVAAVELVGLLPRAELERCSPDFRAWTGLDEASTIEARIARGPN
jgi:glutamate formiminotransferase / 5-formyltetrahydrofolate cyclo-ligase